jgi:hypothetical protein
VQVVSATCGPTSSEAAGPYGFHKTLSWYLKTIRIGENHALHPSNIDIPYFNMALEEYLLEDARFGRLPVFLCAQADR